MSLIYYKYLRFIIDSSAFLLRTYRLISGDHKVYLEASSEENS